MADVITSAVAVNTSARITTSYGQLAPSFDTFKNNFANGVGNNQADMVCFTEVTIASSGAPTTINLGDGSLHMPNGAAFAPVKVKEISSTTPTHEQSDRRRRNAAVYAVAGGNHAD
jgi:hypothetical protein